MPAGLILESLVAVLLSVSIGYCFVLNRRLVAMRDGQNEMRQVVRALNEAAEKARAGMEMLRQNGLPIVEDLGGKIKSARAMADELGLIIESANNLAERLTSPSLRNNIAVRKPEPLEGLARIDESFRRNAGAVSERNEKKPVNSDSVTPESDLRAALRAMR